MKKLISLILAVLMVALCACSIAEGTEESGKSVILRIKEGVTAQVFKKPGDEKAVDTLTGGQICGLLDEGTTEAGFAWFQVFYLNSKRNGTPGFINAEDAEQLTEEQLKALMDDPAMLNEILDLIEAMDTYLNKKTGNEGTGSTTGSATTATPENELKALYEQAMKELQKLFDKGTSLDLDKLEKKGKELADQAKKAGEELIDKAKKAEKNLKEDVTTALDSMKGKDTDAAIDSLMDSISESIEKRTGKSDEKIDDALKKVSDALKNLDKQLGTGSGDAIDNVSSVMNKTKDWLNDTQFSKVNEAMKQLSDKFKGDGFASGVGKNGIGTFLDTLKGIFPKK